MTVVTSWGRTRRANEDLQEPAFADEVPDCLRGGPVLLGYGMGRSYGDVCLNDGGRLVSMRRLDRVLAADWEKGILRAEAGCSLDQLLRLTVPRGWFLPVTPGTKFVTLGGAVANDVHGKNHEVAGTFGCHIRSIGLCRSTGESSELGPENEPELFAATVGGLGLTGLILWVELQLSPIASAYFETETLRMDGLDDFFRRAAESRDWPFTVSWVDCLQAGTSLGSGLFTRACFATDGRLEAHRARPAIAIPLDAPGWLLGGTSVALFNRLYARRPGVVGRSQVHYDSALFPLDGIDNWNRLYGRHGFFQHQSVVPLATAEAAIRNLLELTAQYRQGSPLVVLKIFGNRASPGLLSFPMEGATLALDLPNRGEETMKLLNRMTDTVIEAGGRIYPAKDAAMSGAAFRAGFPNWRRLEAARDPAFSSDFWRRVTRDAA